MGSLTLTPLQIILAKTWGAPGSHSLLCHFPKAIAVLLQ